MPVFLRAFTIFLFAVFFTAACGANPQVQNQTEVQFAPEVVRLGETVYTAQCASCHGANLEGQPNWKESNPDGSFRAPPHDATGHTWHHGDETLLRAIRAGGDRLAEMNMAGVSNMPAYEGTLTEEEITAVLTYIKSTWPSDIQEMQAEATRREGLQ